MKTMEKIKKFAKENKTVAKVALVSCVAGYIGISIWEAQNLKTVYRKDWERVTGEGPFDTLLNKPISDAFATVEYADGEIGIVKLADEDTMVNLFNLMFPDVLQEK